MRYVKRCAMGVYYVSVLYGFVIVLMLLFIAYTAYRLFFRRKAFILASLALQITAETLAILCFSGNVQMSSLVEIMLLLFGITVPAAFFLTDYYKMVKGIREQGAYGGFLEAMPREHEKEAAGDTADRYINPLIKEKQVPELVRDLSLNGEEIIKNIKKNLLQAQAYLNKSDYDNAYEIYSMLIRLVNNCPGLFYNYGNICYYKAQYIEAVQSYKKALAINESLAGEAKSSQDAFTVLKPAKETGGRNKSERDVRREEYMVYYNLGNAQFKLNRFQQAIESYMKALEINPVLEDANENIARAMIALKKVDEAIEYYKKIVEKEKNNYKLHLIIGKLYSEINQYAEAEKELKESLRLNNGCKEGYEELGKILLKQGRYGEAVDIYKKLSRISPEDFKAYYNLGVCQYQSGLIEESTRSYKKAIELKPDSYRAYYNLAIALDGMGRPDEAIAYLKKVIELKPDFTDAYNNLGVLLSTQGKHLEALGVYTKGLKKNPEDYGLFYNMGITLAEMRRYGEAVEAYKSALELKPDEYEISYHLGAALIELKKYNEAVEVYKSALKIKPEDSEIFYNLSIIYALLKKQDIAVDNLRKAIELNSDIKEDARYNKAFDSLRQINAFKEVVS
ncbi:MAG: tetratricopeptide repeat protein [Clostridiales bacterium]|jgi:tetratricopeptide (TPR) repeat protein|nr:tetratricopeptide repeat protein [Eubacteriales bacterium]MDH7565166.1 tetratricopeptide repeat protein [Clostridiales bacterium]